MAKRGTYPTSTSHPYMEDATEPVDFTVTKQDRYGSVVGHPDACAGACALKRLPGVVNAWVIRTRAFIEYGDGRLLRYGNPEKLEKAIDSFDFTSGYFPDGTYRLTPIEESNRIGARQKRPSSTNDGSKPELSKPQKTYHVNPNAIR